MNDAASDEWQRVVKARKRPDVEDAVRICKLEGSNSPSRLWEVLGKLLQEWSDIHDMTGSWE